MSLHLNRSKLLMAQTELDMKLLSCGPAMEKLESVTVCGCWAHQESIDWAQQRFLMRLSVDHRRSVELWKYSGQWVTMQQRHD